MRIISHKGKMIILASSTPRSGWHVGIEKQIINTLNIHVNDVSTQENDYYMDFPYLPADRQVFL